MHLSLFEVVVAVGKSKVVGLNNSSVGIFFFFGFFFSEFRDIW